MTRVVLAVSLKGVDDLGQIGVVERRQEVRLAVEGVQRLGPLSGRR
jgi:hypothetical protein